VRIALITLHAIKNYGSVLQTLATQEKFKELGCETVVINFIREDSKDCNVYKRWTINDKFPIKIIKSIILFPTAKRWKRIFGGFLKKNVNLTECEYYTEQELEDNLPEADIYCTGSDQVWNSTWNKGYIPAFFLEFVPEGKKRISFAASIGKSFLDDWEKEPMAKALRKYNAISVREDSAVEILKGIGIDNVCHVIDPTLAMRKEYWQSIASPRMILENYVLVYQLNHNKEFDDYAVEFAKRKNKKLVRLCTRYDQCRLPGKHVFLPEVEGFISLITYADFIITDSFHATAFSLNMNKEIICIYPNDFSSRIKSILKATKLEERHLKDFNNFGIADKSIDFEYVNNYFEMQRKNLDTFLIDALELKKEK